MIEIGTAISSLAALKSIFDGAVSMRDESKVMDVKLAFQQQLFEVQNALLAVQNALAQAVQEKRDVEEKLRAVEQFEKDMQGYDAFETAPGVFVYALEASDGSGPQQPYFCYACHQDRKKSVLGFEELKGDMARSTLQCMSNALHRFELPRGWRRQTFLNNQKPPQGAA